MKQTTIELSKFPAMKKSIVMDGLIVHPNQKGMATIAVTYPAGSVCKCTKGNTVLTAVGTSGSFTFTVSEPGDWVVSCTDGTDSDSQTVSIIVRLAEKVRKHFGKPMTISSGVRCQAHNDELRGSVPNSRHVKGKAVDFTVSGFSASSVLDYVQHTSGVRYAYAIDGSFVHMDVE